MISRVVVLGLFAGCDATFGLVRVAPPDAPSTYPAAVLADRPVGYFRLGELAGVTAADRIAGADPGVIVGNVSLGQPGAIAGDPDTAMGLDGANGAIEVGDEFAFPGTAAFSLECWVSPAVFDGKPHELITRWHDPPDNEGYQLHYKDDMVVLSREDYTAAVTDLASVTGLVVGVYSHVVGTYDGETLTVYVDGRQLTQAASTHVLPDVTEEFMIGAGNDDPTVATLNGLIDEVAIYDAALTPDRVAAHYAAGAPP